MFYETKNKSAMNHWFNWLDAPEIEELFYKIYHLVEDMIKEILPQLLKEYSHLIDLEVIAELNGKKIELNEIEDKLTDFVIEKFKKGLTSNFKH